MSVDGYWLLSPDPTAPHDARRLVQDWAARLDVGVEDSHDLLLVTSEMVTNAVAHTSGSVGLGVGAGPQTVTVWVTDAGLRGLRGAHSLAGSTHGHGLTIVRALSLAWESDEGRRARPSGRGCPSVEALRATVSHNRKGIVGPFVMGARQSGW